MKRTIFAAILMAVCTISAQAQFEIDSLGRVNIMPAVNSWKPTLKIGNSTTFGAGVNIKDVGHHYNMEVTRTLSDTASVGILVNMSNDYNKTTGLHCISQGGGGYSPYVYGVSTSVTGGNNTIGVFGKAFNYGSGSNISAVGIYGTSQNISEATVAYPGHYGGYFNGNVRVASGSIYGTLVTPATISGGGNTQGVSVITSDRDGGESVTGRLAQVQAIQFLRDKREIGDDLTDEERKEKELDPRPSTIQYGLAADQLKEVYPELVYEDKEGNISINYIEMIPLLVQSINELSEELAELKGTSSKKKAKAKAQTTAIEDAVGDIDQVRMDQNKPNPFSESTVIKLNIPKDTKTATIYIYDLSGKQVQSVPVTERGETDITVYASDLSAGMYIYTLVTDGQVKVTRRMMVSEK